MEQVRRKRAEGDGRENKLESSHEAMQLDVRARALMLVKEIKCPHKGLDSGGLHCFLSRARQCDNCFSNIRNLPPSKPELKKEVGKKEDIKKGKPLDRVWAPHGFMCHTVSQLPSYRVVHCFWRWSGNIAAVSGIKNATVEAPTQWRVLKEKVTSSELFFPKPLCWAPGFHQCTLLKWQRSC